MLGTFSALPRAFIDKYPISTLKELIKKLRGVGLDVESIIQFVKLFGHGKMTLISDVTHIE